MSPSRAAGLGKAPKKGRGKKASSVSVSPLGYTVQPAPAIEFPNLAQSRFPKEMETRPRSKSYGAASMAAQILSQFSAGGERNTAATKASKLNGTQKLPDVFAFLDKSQDVDASSAVESPERILDPGNMVKHTSKARRGKSSLAAQNSHSDSGVSIRGYSPDRASSVVSRDSVEYQPPTPQDVGFNEVNWKLAAGSQTRVPMAGAFLTDAETLVDSSAAPNVDDLVVPEAYYYPKKPSVPSDPFMPSMRKASKPKLDLGSLKLSDKPRRLSSGSASVYSSTSRSKPDTRPRLYRKFRDLNHRLLCYLQEDIAQMEDDLETLDELETMQLSPSDAQNSPRQKLLAAKLHDLQINDWSVLRYKRQDLMEKILARTEQYNRTLYTYSKTMKALPPATEQDVDSYRAAVQGNMTKTDRRILGHDTDLVILDPNLLYSRPNPLYATVSALFAAILLPLLAFGAISEFFGRVVVVAFTGAAIAFWASHGPPGNEYAIAPQNAWAYAVLYFSFMSIAAMVIP
ncbi:hypothetical protein VTO42DRAFT_5325 [Malbranchea cinnamomea]